jgi:hypothetical protein
MHLSCLWYRAVKALNKIIALLSISGAGISARVCACGHQEMGILGWATAAARAIKISIGTGDSCSNKFNKTAATDSVDSGSRGVQQYCIQE